MHTRTTMLPLPSASRVRDLHYNQNPSYRNHGLPLAPMGKTPLAAHFSRTLLKSTGLSAWR